MCVFLCRKWSYAVGGNMVTKKKTKNKSVNEKFSLIQVSVII